MTEDKHDRITKQVKRLHAAMGETNYLLGYVYSEDGEKEGKAMLYVNVRTEQQAKDMAVFLLNAAKQNPVFGAMLDYVRAMQDVERTTQQPKKKSGLILPKMGIVK